MTCPILAISNQGDSTTIEAINGVPQACGTPLNVRAKSLGSVDLDVAAGQDAAGGVAAVGLDLERVAPGARLAQVVHVDAVVGPDPVDLGGPEEGGMRP